jgi:16S rRNA (cytidine1402-2'-O)-methyltransferase
MRDITQRVVDTLREVDLIAAEDTRHSRILLNVHDIHVPMTSYHEHNQDEKGTILLDKLKSGASIALITDAGTPGISDPGESLVRRCHEAGISVTSLPGACACITALTLSGLPTRRFCFEGFLPIDKKERKEILESLVNECRTMILYEAPHRLHKTLKELSQTLGNRTIVLCRELTKKFESVIRTTLEEAVVNYETEEARGEFVLVIEGKDLHSLRQEEQIQNQQISVEEHVANFQTQGFTEKEAMKQAALKLGISKREVYAQLKTKQ